jgi:RNA polymerase sigma-70 factor, ECF subfamily
LKKVLCSRKKPGSEKVKVHAIMIVRGVERLVSQPVSCLDCDLDLVHQIAGGDEKALETLYIHQERRLYSFAYHLVGDPDLATEVVQESLIAAWQGAKSFRGEGRVSTWLLGIVHHKAMNAVRKKRVSQVTLETAEPLGDLGFGPVELAAGRELQKAIRLGLRQLSMEHRTVLELVFFQGLSQAEVAQVCGCPLGTVKSRLNHAKFNLRRILERMGIHLEDIE